MFRSIRRFKQQLSEQECQEVLMQEKRAVLSVLGDEGYPYGLPINYLYRPEDGAIYFHGARTGHKVDAIRACNKVSLCVYDHGYTRAGEWALNVRSVIVFGRMEFVDDPALACEICRELAYKFTQDEAYIDDEIERFSKVVQCLKLRIEHMTGKLVNES